MAGNYYSGYPGSMSNMYLNRSKTTGMFAQPQSFMGIRGFQPKPPGTGMMLDPNDMLRAQVEMRNAMLGSQTQLALGGMRNQNDRRQLQMSALMNKGNLGMGMAGLGGQFLSGVVAPWHMQQARMPTRGQANKAMGYFTKRR